MKKLFCLLSLVGILAFSVSCKKDDDAAPSINNNNTPTLSDKLNKKWEVSSSARTAATAPEYTSFEFTDEGTFYIIKYDKSFLRGDFTLSVGDSVVTLDGVGVIYIDDITETTITFRLVLTGNPTPVTVSAAPATTISTTAATGQITGKTWSFKTRTENGVPNTTINSYFSSGSFYMKVTMSDYGTYSIDTNVPGNAPAVGIWKWCDTGETSFSTSNDPTVIPDCSASNTAVVSFDTDGNMVLTHVINAVNTVDTYALVP